MADAGVVSMPTSKGRLTRARAAGTVLAWLLAATAATLVGAVAVGAIGSGIVSPADHPLSPAEVSARLAEPAGPAQSPSTGASTTTTRSTGAPPTATTAAPKVINSAGGTVLARCAPELEIVSATPAQGYRLKDVEPHDGGARVRFETHDSRVEVTVSCAGGTPQA